MSLQEIHSFQPDPKTSPNQADDGLWRADHGASRVQAFHARLLRCSAATFALVLGSGIAFAQDTDASTSDSGLEEIIVTAQHRSQRLQDVPLAVTSLSAAALGQQGVTSTTDLAQATPSLVFNSQLSVANPYIRGVGSSLFDPTSESAVAIYVDDVYMAAPQANIFTLAGVKQIDVLKGPQGTLFGRNATGGVIQIQMLDPTHDPSLDASVTYGNYDFVSASFYGATGLSDNVSTSLTTLYENQGKGFGRNLADGSEINKLAQDNITLRNKWVVDLPTETVIRLVADYSENNNNISYQRLPGSPSPLPGATPPTAYPGEYNTNINQPNFIRVKTGGVSLKVDQDFDAVRLVSISAFRKLRASYGLDQDQTVLPVIDIDWKVKFHNYSQELRIQSQDDAAFNWQIGAYYYNAKGGYDPLAINDTIVIPYDAQKVESIAGFAQATVELFSDTNLTGGIRYTKEDQRFEFPLANMRLKQSVEEPTFRIALDHHFTPDILGYVSFNTGFKSGGYVLLQPGNAYKPEKLKSYEAGLKTQLFDDKLRLNINGFIYRYTDQQVQVTGIGGNFTDNAAGSNLKGVELDFDYMPTSRLKFSGGLSLIDGEYSDYPGFLARDTLGNPIPPGIINAKGRTTPRTPKFVGNLSVHYDLPTRIGEFVSSAGVQYNDGYFWDAQNRLRQPSYAIVNGSIAWTPNDGPFDMRVWAKNLFDATYYSIRNAAAFPVGDNQVQAPPRTFGVTLTYHY